MSKTCSTQPCTPKLSLKVKNGKITKFTYKVGQFTQTVKPAKPIKVSSKGKFSYKKTVSEVSGTRDILTGKFTTKSKVKGSYERKSFDSTLAVSKTKFTLKRK